MPAPRKRPLVKKMVPAHPDLRDGLIRLCDEGRDTPYLFKFRDLNPTYQEVLRDMYAKKVPA